MTGGALFVHSLARIQRVSPGFETGSLLTLRLTLPWERYPGAASGLFFGQLVERLEDLPGVEGAAATSQFPPNAFARARLVIEGESASTDSLLPTAFTTLVSRGYFETLGVPLLRGRLFGDDRPDTPPVAVLNDVAARRLFGGGAAALGRRFRAREDGPWVEVVGVVGATRNRGLEVPPEPEVFLPLDQHAGDSNQLFVVVRSASDPRAMLPAVRTIVQSLDPDQPLYAVRTVDEAFAIELGPRRAATIALAVFTVFSLLLASVGVYGVVSYMVSLRTRELGVRMALGASRWGIRALVVRESSGPVVAGLLLGLAGALALGQLVAGQLVDVGAHDPVTLLIAAGTLLAAAALAAYLPARRASQVDPVSILRND